MQQPAPPTMQQPAPPPMQQPAPPPMQQPAYPPAGGTPTLIAETGAQLTLTPGKTEYLIGREDPVSNSFPDVDLTPHGGDQGGVSRRHARLLNQGGQWLLEDLGAINFTFVNNQKVLPNQPVPVSNGAELRFGKVKVTFQL
jgi:pSer/pThr/pTyr-binding forkhead associated (FHA) protein